MPKALNRFKGRIVHLTHTDLDAVCSDAVMRRKHGDVLTIYSSVQDFGEYIDHLAASPAQPLSLCLSDLGGHSGVLGALAQLKLKGWHIEWRDHHVWDEQTLTRVAEIVDYLRVDPDFCACEIVNQDLLPNDPVAREIAAVGRDRDFWINQDARSEILSTVVYDDFWRQQVSQKLSKGVFLDQDVEREYERQTQKKDKSIKRAIERSRTVDHIAVTVSQHYASDVAALLRSKYHSTIEIVLRSNGTFSIRSIEPISNCIAEQFAGGGHPHAAGGNLLFNVLDRIMFSVWPFRLKKVQELVRTASTFTKS